MLGGSVALRAFAIAWIVWIAMTAVRTILGTGTTRFSRISVTTRAHRISVPAWGVAPWGAIPARIRLGGGLGSRLHLLYPS